MRQLISMSLPARDTAGMIGVDEGSLAIHSVSDRMSGANIYIRTS